MYNFAQFIIVINTTYEFDVSDQSLPYCKIRHRIRRRK